LISHRGVRKTFFVLKELIKLSQLPDKYGYTTFLYVSDITNDATVNKLINHIRLHVLIVGYNQVLLVPHDLIDSKSTYEDILNKNLQDHVSDEIKKIYSKLLIYRIILPSLFKQIDVEIFFSHFLHILQIYFYDKSCD
jgi:hypothetical protein